MSFITYLREVRGELTHISWPTTRQAIVYTALIVIISVFMAAYTGALDFLFQEGLKLFLTR